MGGGGEGPTAKDLLLQCRGCEKNEPKCARKMGRLGKRKIPTEFRSRVPVRSVRWGAGMVGGRCPGRNSTVLGGEGCAMGSPWGKIRLLSLVLGGEGGWRPTEKRILKLFGQR